MKQHPLDPIEMLAKKLIDKNFTPLHNSDPVYAALAKMDAWQTTSLPVVEPTTGKIIGQVTLQMLIDLPDESVLLNEIKLKEPIFSFEHQHVFEVARQLVRHEVRIIPVVNESEEFIGVLQEKDVLKAFSEMLNVSRSGSVITVEIGNADFTLTEIVNLIELESAKILGVTVEHGNEDNPNLNISFKLNVEDTSAVVSSLKRHGYATVTENTHDLLEVDMSSRANELIRYLDL
ncbi:MAG: CBS domain-containing protein [Balneolaceae bacterium]